MDTNIDDNSATQFLLTTEAGDDSIPAEYRALASVIGSRMWHECRSRARMNPWQLFTDEELFKIQESLPVGPFDHGYRKKIGQEIIRRDAKYVVKITTLKHE